MMRQPRGLHVTRVRPDVTVRWRVLQSDDVGLRSSRCLYALLRRDRKEILYIGKADRQTVAQRLGCWKKDRMWRHLARQRVSNCLALIGEVTLEYGGRYSGELLSDIESLLIMGEQPTGNVQSRKSRISRSGLCIACTGN